MRTASSPAATAAHSSVPSSTSNGVGAPSRDRMRITLPRRRANEYKRSPSMPSLVRRSLLAVLLTRTAGGCVLITGDFDLLSRRPHPLAEQVVSGSGRAKVLLLDLSGVISSEERAGPLGL